VFQGLAQGARRPSAGFTALKGTVFADNGYLSQPLMRELFRTWKIRLVTHVKRNMANRLLPLQHKLLLRRRAIMETVFDQLKHLMQVEHTRYRGATNFAVNLVAGLVAYCHQPNKPSIYRNGRPQLMAAIPNRRYTTSVIIRY
jgi:hypothetical protein